MEQHWYGSSVARSLRDALKSVDGMEMRLPDPVLKDFQKVAHHALHSRQPAGAPQKHLQRMLAAWLGLLRESRIESMRARMQRVCQLTKFWAPSVSIFLSTDALVQAGDSNNIALCVASDAT